MFDTFTLKQTTPYLHSRLILLIKVYSNQIWIINIPVKCQWLMAFWKLPTYEILKLMSLIHTYIPVIIIHKILLIMNNTMMMMLLNINTRLPLPAHSIFSIKYWFLFLVLYRTPISNRENITLLYIERGVLDIVLNIHKNNFFLSRYAHTVVGKVFS